MEKQMKAERERRKSILKAEGEKTSTILVAEGKKKEAILAAEAEKEAEILKAEAKKEAAIREAEGQAKAIKAIKEAGADAAVLQLKSLEAFAKIADGKATKIIIPSELQGIVGNVNAITESINKKANEI